MTTAPEKVVLAELPLKVLAAPDNVYWPLPEVKAPLLVKFPGKVIASLLAELSKLPLLLTVTSPKNCGALALITCRVPETEVVVAARTWVSFKVPEDRVKAVAVAAPAR